LVDPKVLDVSPGSSDLGMQTPIIWQIGVDRYQNENPIGFFPANLIRLVENPRENSVDMGEMIIQIEKSLKFGIGQDR